MSEEFEETREPFDKEATKDSGAKGASDEKKTEDAFFLSDLDTSTFEELDFTCIVVSNTNTPGQDFAYTTGLYENYGILDLHIWSKPTHGLDPGEDFILSYSDMAGLLEMLALRCKKKKLQTGDTFSHLVDGGDPLLTFELYEKVEKEEVEAFQTSSPQVIPVKWSLERVEIGKDEGVSQKTKEEIAFWTKEILDEVNPLKRKAVRINTDTKEPFGPFTPVISAMLQKAEELEKEHFYPLAFYTQKAREEGVPLPYVLGKLASVARRAGRVDAQRNIVEKVSEVVTSAFMKEVQKGIVTPQEVNALHQGVFYALACGFSAWVLKDHLSQDEFYEAFGILSLYMTLHQVGITDLETARNSQEVKNYWEELSYSSIGDVWKLELEKAEADASLNHSRYTAKMLALCNKRGAPWLSVSLNPQINEYLDKKTKDLALKAARDTTVALATKDLLPLKMFEALTKAWPAKPLA